MTLKLVWDESVLSIYRGKGAPGIQIWNGVWNGKKYEMDRDCGMAITGEHSS